MSELVEVVHDWIPLVGTTAVGAAVLFFLRWLLLVRGGGPIGEQRFYRQSLLLAVTVLLVVLVVFALPIHEETKNHVLALFGVLGSAAVAFSSTTFVGNAMAGLMLRVVKSFRPGDFLIVEEQFGRVTEMGLLHVEIQTPYRDLATVPNQYLISRPVTVVRDSGTFVHAEVSLGYDVAHWRVEPLLTKAAIDAGLEDPFVTIGDLGDYAVSYRVAGLLRNVRELIEARSDLRKHMLDALHGGGVEIVSPPFLNLRQPASGERFVPGEAPPTTAERDDVPEQTIFDKADRAAARDHLCRELEDLEARLEELRHRPAKDEDEATAARVRREIERTEKRRELLRARLAADDR
ncbi:MAG: mechanosensitive ion channel domain-containing protein [Sandaracinaceae bacterium]